MTYVYLIAAGVGAGALTWLMRVIAIKHKLIDVPNARSSHAHPTPRGGGLSFVAVTLLALLVLANEQRIQDELALGLGGALALVAVIGFIDDRSSLSARVRLAVQGVATAWFLLCIQPSWFLLLPAGTWDMGWLGWILAPLWMIWLINLYNFMDGIDGLAAVEAVTVSLAAALLLYADSYHEISLLLAILGSACAGFLVFNWPPAKIFMGDTGSGFLGCFFGGLALGTHVTGILSIWVWIILLGTFLVDGTVTLISRLVNGQSLTEAHRGHAYQRSVRRFGNHERVTVTVALINVLWLFPLALMSSRHPSWGLITACIALSPLAALAIWLGAGQRD